MGTSAHTSMFSRDQFALGVRCPHCHADDSEPCRSSSGVVVYPHKARVKLAHRVEAAPGKLANGIDPVTNRRFLKR